MTLHGSRRCASTCSARWSTGARAWPARPRRRWRRAGSASTGPPSRTRGGRATSPRWRRSGRAADRSSSSTSSTARTWRRAGGLRRHGPAGGGAGRPQPGLAPARPLARRGRGPRPAAAAPRPGPALERQRPAHARPRPARRAALGRDPGRGGGAGVQALARGVLRSAELLDLPPSGLRDGGGPQRRPRGGAGAGASGPRSCRARSSTGQGRRRPGAGRAPGTWSRATSRELAERLGC